MKIILVKTVFFVISLYVDILLALKGNVMIERQFILKNLYNYEIQYL